MPPLQDQHCGSTGFWETGSGRQGLFAFPKSPRRLEARHELRQLRVEALAYLPYLSDVFVSVFVREVGWYVSVVVDPHSPLAVLVYPQSRMFHEFEITGEAAHAATTEQQTEEPYTEASSK